MSQLEIVQRLYRAMNRRGEKEKENVIINKFYLSYQYRRSCLPRARLIAYRNQCLNKPNQIGYLYSIVESIAFTSSAFPSLGSLGAEHDLCKCSIIT